jgi:hypothetical protein
MQWKKSTEAVPNDGEEVLIRISNEYHLATYNRGQNSFIQRNGQEQNVSDKLYWTPLIAP